MARAERHTICMARVRWNSDNTPAHCYAGTSTCSYGIHVGLELGGTHAWAAVCVCMATGPGPPGAREWGR